MKTKYEVHLRRIDYTNNKLPLFLIFARDKLNTRFQVTKDNVAFQFSLGMTAASPELHSYTDIQFETDLDANLVIFEQEVPPIIETEHLKLESPEGVELKRLKEAERTKIETQLANLFPLVLEAFNTFRRSCRIALYRESVQGRILVQNIQASQRYRGVEVNHSLENDFAHDDTEFLFGAFADLGLCTFTGEADIEYSVRSTSGQVLTGVFRNGYKGLHSVNRFPEKLDVIQGLIDDGWSIEADALLASLEFLYSDNYRMAVFNAATILEFALVRFWENKRKQLESGSRQEREKAASLERRMKAEKGEYKDVVERILGIVLPEFIEQLLVTDGTLNRCAEAWSTRNKRLAHLVESRQVTSTQAWNAVSSIICLVDALAKL